LVISDEWPSANADFASSFLPLPFFLGFATIKEMDPLELQGSLTILNVGTKILLRDVMDAYLRTLGDVRTHYATNMASAMRTMTQSNVSILVTELDLEDASAYRMLKEIGGPGGFDDLFVVLALTEKNDALMALATEMEVHAVLVKPFANSELKKIFDQYRAWREMPKQPWELLIAEAHQGERERRYNDAEKDFREAMAIASNIPDPFYKAGMYYMRKHDYPSAEKLFSKALANKADHIQSLYAIAKVYIYQKELDRAEHFLEKVNQLSPLNPERTLELARLYLERASDSYKTALRLDPDAPGARFGLGKLLALLKDYPGCIRELQRATPTLKVDAQKKEAETFMALARKLGGLLK